MIQTLTSQIKCGRRKESILKNIQHNFLNRTLLLNHQNQEEPMTMLTMHIIFPITMVISSFLRPCNMDIQLLDI